MSQQTMTWGEVVKVLEGRVGERSALRRLGLYTLSKFLSKEEAMDALFVGSGYTEEHLRRIRKELRAFYD